jgi:hypothetical protein
MLLAHAVAILQGSLCQPCTPCCKVLTLLRLLLSVFLLLQFLSEEERDALQQVMDDQASTERKYENERTMACYWEKIRTACRNPITFVAALWGFFYFWAYYGIIYVSECGLLAHWCRAGVCMMRQLPD